MKYKNFLSLFLAVSIVFGQTTLAETLIAPEEALQSWWAAKESQATIITDVTLDAELYEMAKEKYDVEELEQAFSQSKSLLASNTESLKKYIEELEIIEARLKKNIELSTEEKTYFEKELSLLSEEITYLQDKQKRVQSFIRETLSNQYQSSLEQQDSTNIYSTFLKKTLGINITSQDALSSVKSSAEQLLERQKFIGEELDTVRNMVANKIASKENIIQKLERYQEELDDTEVLKKQVLSNNIQEVSFQEKVQELAKKKQDLTEKIEQKFSKYERDLLLKVSDYDCENRDGEVCSWIKKYTAAERDFLNLGVSFQNASWPVTPEKGFGYHFRDQKYFHTLDIHHEGLDIIVDPGQAISPISEGYVLLKQSPSSTSPGVVIIKHPEGYMSMYIGVTPEENLVLFSSVLPGQTIAYTRDFSAHSNANNVHIELYQNGIAIDVFEKLDSSNMSPEFIPARYGWKYIDDLKKAGKNPDIESLQKIINFFYIPGEAESMRQETFLETYASSSFSDRNMWVRQSVAEGIDPSFVLCVGFAESSLGRNLTTDGNIGNVGNTDSGDRRSYDGPESGIRAISSVVNNRWLGHYNTINELSGWGNPLGPIYASSPTNWHENIVKCMSALKGKYVTNNSPFRLTRASLLIYEQEGFTVENIQ